MHELTIRISRAFCRGVFPQLNGELEADTALASNSATSGFGERENPSASLPDSNLKRRKNSRAFGVSRSPTPTSRLLR
ncbi:MAG: hypothetical protein FWF88_13065, partial [Peptococcaceae bacterium]|nr:hypothetical protein [Peptococcaceae bacterium]